MNAIILTSILLGFLIAMVVLLRFTILKISNSTHFPRLSWVASSIVGIVFLFLLVLAQIQTAEAEKQYFIAIENLRAAEQAQATADNNAKEAMEQKAMLEETLKKAEQLSQQLENCK